MRIYAYKNYSLKAILAAACFVIAPNAYSDWLNDATYKCDDPIILSSQPFMMQWLSKPYSYNKTDTGAGKIYMQISQKEFNDKNLLFVDRFEINRVQLDADKASMLREYFERRERTYAFPLWSQQLPSLAALALTAAEGLVFGSAFSVFFDNMGAKKASMDLAEQLIVDGGEIVQYGAINFVNGNGVLDEGVDYHVKVGNVTKYITLFNCKYPAEVVMSEVKTVYPPNNPKIFRSTGGEWQMINADTSAVERKYQKTSEDREYYYLKEIGGFGSEIRVSRFNGPIERLTEGTWGQLYSETEIIH